MCEHFILQNGSNFQLVCGENCHLFWSRVFNVKIATFEVLHVKIAMIGGWLVGWLVGGGNSKIAAHILVLSITVQTDTTKQVQTFRECSPPFNLLWFLGNMSPSPSSQIGVPSKALGAVGSCGWVKGRSEKEQHWLCARCSNKSWTISSLFERVKANVRSTQISLPRFLGIRSFGLSP